MKRFNPFSRNSNKRPSWAEQWLPGKPLSKESYPFRETLVFGSPESEVPSHVAIINPLKEPSGNFYDWATDGLSDNEVHKESVSKNENLRPTFDEITKRIGDLAVNVRCTDNPIGVASSEIIACLQELPDELM